MIELSYKCVSTDVIYRLMAGRFLSYCCSHLRIQPDVFISLNKISWTKAFYILASKFTLEQATEGQRGVELWPCSFFNLGASWGLVVNATPRPFYSQEIPGTHYIGGWVGLRARLDGRGKFRPPPAFYPGNAQPVASLCTD